jgi:hypothetical protein
MAMTERELAMQQARKERWKAERKRVREEKKQRERRYVQALGTKRPRIREPFWYREYLKTPHWRAFKKRWRKWLAKSGRWGCMVCKDPRFEAHHWTYERIGHELLTDVVPLCRRHHAAAHRREKEGVPLAKAHLEL